MKRKSITTKRLLKDKLILKPLSMANSPRYIVSNEDEAQRLYLEKEIKERSKS
jgi:hypothetical protein